MFRPFILLLFLVIGFAQPTLAGPSSNTENSSAALTIEPKPLAAGDSIWAGIKYTLQPHWHLYWENPGDSGLPVEYSWTLPDGITAGPIHWLPPKRIPYAGLYNYGYENKVTLLAPLTASEELAPGDYPITLKANWLICKDICIPESAEFSFTVSSENISVDSSSQRVIDLAVKNMPKPFNGTALYMHDETIVIHLNSPDFPSKNIEKVWWYPVTEGIITNDSEQTVTQSGDAIAIEVARGSQPLEMAFKGLLALTTDQGEEFYLANAELDGVPVTPEAEKPEPTIETAPAAESHMGVFTAIIFAFLGGIILNAMPCVLPILSLKALSIAKKADKESFHIRLQGLSYTAGIVVSFLAVAAMLIALQQAGLAVGWGFQLQSPAFVTALIFVLLLVGLNLSGVFEFTFAMNSNGNNDNADSLKGSFFTGVLATLVATPCTAPFMATAIGFAFTQPPIVLMLIFIALGLGLAFPLLLISFLPSLIRLLPKPGAWMVRFKQFLAFPIYASAAWLLWVLAQQSGPMGLAYALVGACFIAFAAWLIPLTQSRGLLHKALWVAAIIVAVGAINAQSTDTAGTHSSDFGEPFSESTLANYLEAKEHVFVDATAAWCITCKVNESIALKSDAVQKAFKEKDMKFLVADWTNHDEEITKYLASFGRNGVPLYVYYAPDEEPVVLPQLLTPNLVVEAIN